MNVRRVLPVTGAPPSLTSIEQRACDQTLFGTRQAWLRESDPARRRELVRQMQLEAVKLIPVARLGQYVRPVLHRRTVQSLVQAAVTAMWNIDIAAR